MKKIISNVQQLTTITKIMCKIRKSNLTNSIEELVKIKLEWLNMHYLVPKKSKLSSKPGNGFQQER